MIEKQHHKWCSITLGYSGGTCTCDLINHTYEFNMDLAGLIDENDRQVVEITRLTELNERYRKALEYYSRLDVEIHQFKEGDSVGQSGKLSDVARAALGEGKS